MTTDTFFGHLFRFSMNDAHIEAVLTAYQKWDINPNWESDSTLKALIEKRYSRWKYRSKFEALVPHKLTHLVAEYRELLCLWSKKDVFDALLDCDTNNRFLVLGCLCDGSCLCIDTKHEHEMRIGSFPFEECSTEDGFLFEQDLFISFPFQYHEYLEYVKTAPEFDPYLYGYGSDQ